MSFFRYPGGKSKLKHEIINSLKNKSHLDSVQYREPFFGGGSIGVMLLLDNPLLNRMWINDKDIGISCLWTALIRYPEDLKEKVLSFTPTVDQFYEMKVKLSDVTLKMPRQRKKIVDIGFHKLAIHQISYSGLGTKSGGPLGGVDQKSDYKIDCRWSPAYICKKIDKLHGRFSSVYVHENGCTNYDFTDLIKDDSCDSLIYLDPPYYVKGNELYQCGFTNDDHVRLSEALKETKHRWVLSYDDCPEIRDMYSWANIDELCVNYSITALKDKDTGERLSTKKIELLIHSNSSDKSGDNILSWIQ